MTDQIPADKVRKIASEMRDAMRREDDGYPYVEFLSDMGDYIRDLEALLPAPPRPTLADMSPVERHACRWMQADTETWGRVVIVCPITVGGDVILLDRCGDVIHEAPAKITPLPDLPRAEWPGEATVPPNTLTEDDQ